jgi:hypothetical protein
VDLGDTARVVAEKKNRRNYILLAGDYETTTTRLRMSTEVMMSKETDPTKPVTVTVRFSPEMEAEVRAVCAEVGLRRADVLRLSIERGLELVRGALAPKRIGMSEEETE